MTLDITLIDDSTRARKDYGDITGLADSLKALGTINPIVLSRNGDGSFRLVAGGRRLRATRSLGFTELHHASILEPGKVGFLFREEVPEDVLKEAELDENLYRLKPKWQEDVLLVDDIHRLKQDKHGHKWGTRQTAELLGKGFGRNEVSKATRIAALIRADDKEILAAENMMQAYAILFKRAEDKALAELIRRDAARTPVATSAVDMSSFLESFSVPLGGPTQRKEGDATCSDLITTTEPSHVSNGELTSNPEGSLVIVPLSKMFSVGDFRDICKTLPDSCFDHIITDIPYGIDMDNMDTRDMSAVAAEHDVQQNVTLMEPFLRESFRLTRSGGFCVFFYDLDWHEYLQSTAEQIGWKVQRWPLIAYKTSACQNNAAQYNFTKNYECAMVLRKDEKTVLRKQQPSSVWMGDFAAERRLYSNPFAKPFDLWKWIFSAVAIPGQKVFDPFCGEMSSCRSAVNCGLQPFGCELKEEHFNRGMEHMKKAYALLYSSNCQFA